MSFYLSNLPGGTCASDKNAPWNSPSATEILSSFRDDYPEREDVLTFLKVTEEDLINEYDEKISYNELIDLFEDQILSYYEG